MRVKICGITNIEDALCAIEYGADALGFVFYENSPRYISFDDAKKIIDMLPPFVERVGLFVDSSQKQIEDACCYSGISRAQLHFDVNTEFLQGCSVPILPVIRARSKDDLLKFGNIYRLVDVYSEDYGGTGQRLDLKIFDGVDISKIILAGGLNDKNLKEIEHMDFYGVDVSSSIELGKRRKDHQKMRRFIENAKAL